MTDDAQPKQPHNPYAQHGETGEFDPVKGWTRGRYVGGGRCEGHEPDCPCKYCIQKRRLEAGRAKQAANRAAGKVPNVYDYRKAEDIFFNQLKKNGSFYSMAEAGAMCKPPIPLDRMYSKSGKAKALTGMSWPERRKKLIEGPILAKQKIAESNAARLAASAIAAERRLHEQPTLSSELQRLQQATLALFEKYIDAIQDAGDVKAAQYAKALGELYKQARDMGNRAPEGGAGDLAEWSAMKEQIEAVIAK